MKRLLKGFGIRLLLLNTLILFSITGFSTKYYVDVTGNNSNNGSSSSPWLTLAHACTNVTTPGDIIHLNAGTFNETLRSNLAVGVSIEGAGIDATIINARYVASNSSDGVIRLNSSTYTNGNQSISYLTLTGSNLTATRGICINYRNNVAINNCKITDFYASGIFFRGSNVAWDVEPNPYCSGNKIFNTTVNSCATRSSGESASIRINGQTGFQLYNNTFNQTFRAMGQNGNILGGEWNKELKIYNNTFTKPDNEGSAWNFFFELWHWQGGGEIYNNTFNGAATMDIVDVMKSTSGFGLKIYDNKYLVKSIVPFTAHQIQAINLEGRSHLDDIHVYNNYMKNVPNGIWIDVVVNEGEGYTSFSVNNLFIHHNVMENVGMTDVNTVPIWMNAYGSNGNITFNNIQVNNNTIQCSNVVKGLNAIKWNVIGKFSNIFIQNNIFTNNKDDVMAFSSSLSGATLTNVSINNNLYYNNGVNAPKFNMAVTNKVENSNIVVNPIFVSSTDLNLQSTSPAINAGLNIGYPYNGTSPDIGAYEAEPIAPPADVTKPVVSSFTIPTSSTTLSVPVSSFNATDNIGVTGYLLTESSTAPTASTTGWTATVPSTYNFSSFGSKTLYACVKDAAGNVSSSVSQITTLAPPPDVTKPVVSSFTIPTSSTTLSVPVTSFTATDNIGVTGYLLTESSTAPTASTTGWTATLPSTYNFSSFGSKTLYAFVKDAAGNVSAGVSQITTLAPPPDVTKPVVSSFTIPTSSTTLSVSVTSFTATDNIGVTGYLLTESSTAPTASTTVWTATVPATYSFSSYGSKTLYAFVKDAAGNVSAGVSQITTLAPPPDVTKPVVSSFTIPTSSTTVSIPVSTFTATDNIGVTGYLLTESSSAPTASTTGWSATIPATYNFSTDGSKVLYAWVKDAAGNVSASVSQATIITLPIVSPTTNTYYLSPNGDDTNGKGTIDSPWFSLNKAWSVVKTGDIIYMKGGTYLYKTSQSLRGKSGVSGNLIKIWAMLGEQPVISPAAEYTGTRGIDIYGNYIHIKGLEIKGYSQRSSTTLYYGIVAENSNNLVLELLKVHDNGFGLSIGSDSGDNLILNSDFYRNADPLSNFGSNVPWRGADGIAIRSTNLSKTNTIRGCRIWWNSDDGVDLYNNEGLIIIENSWSFWNGYQPGTFTAAGNGDGFKIGATLTDQSTLVKRILRNNLAFENKLIGFDQNNARCITHLYNNTSYNNASLGSAARSFNFWNGTAATVAKNNLDYKQSLSALFNSQAIVSNNTFLINGAVNTAYSVSNADFVSLDRTGVDGSRQNDGSLPNLNFLKLASGSDLINKGTNVGLAYSGTAPDLGAFESNYTTDVIAPVITAFTIPATSGSLTVPVSSFTATDNVGVTGYLLSQTSTVPTAVTTGWSTSKPTSYTFSSSGTKTLYAWVKDATGNVSATASDGVIITLSNLTVNPDETKVDMHFSTISKDNGSGTMNIELTGFSVNTISASDELAVFDGNTCVSSIKLSDTDLTNGYVKLIAPAGTNDQQGFTNGHSIQIWLWNEKSGIESQLQAEATNGKMVFEAQSSSVIQLKFLTTGIPDILKSLKIDVFPNPCKDYMTVRFSEVPENGSHIEIIDNAGRVIESRNIQNAQESFNLNQRPNGLYIVKTIIGSNEIINKLIINK